MQIFLHLYIVGSGEKVQIGGRARQHHNKPSCWASPPLKLDDTLPDDDDLSMNNRPPVPLSPPLLSQFHKATVTGRSPWWLLSYSHVVWI